MWFEFAEYACTSASGIQAVICWRLLRQGRNLTFINLLLAIHFFVNSITSYIYITLFFKIGSVHFFETEKDPSEIVTQCNTLMYVMITFYLVASATNIDIIFIRFTYVRYAHGLIADMGRLLHKITFLTFAVFTSWLLLVWHIRHILNNDKQRNTVKGMICNQVPFPDLREKFILLYIKPKLLACVGVALVSIFLAYMNSSSVNQMSRYTIPNVRWNLLNMKQHTNYLYVSNFCFVFDHLAINGGLQVFQSELSPENVFKIWWIWQVVMFLITNILAPLAAIYAAGTEYPEFSGLRGRRFPGQKKPREQQILPAGRVKIEQALRNTLMVWSSTILFTNKSTERQAAAFPAVETF